MEVELDLYADDLEQDFNQNKVSVFQSTASQATSSFSFSPLPEITVYKNIIIIVRVSTTTIPHSNLNLLCSRTISEAMAAWICMTT